MLGLPYDTHTSTEQERAEFEAWIRTHEDEHGAVDEASAWAAWTARSLVQAARRAPAVPQGWRLAPEKASNEMAKAGAQAAREYLERTGGNSPWAIYEAMLAAAPQPPEAQSTPTAYRADAHKGECIDEHCPGCCEPAAAPDLAKLAMYVLAKRAENAPVQPHEDAIAEFMKLVDAYGDACEAFGDYQVPENSKTCVHAREAIESQVRELLAQRGAKDGANG